MNPHWFWQSLNGIAKQPDIIADLACKAESQLGLIRFRQRHDTLLQVLMPVAPPVDMDLPTSPASTLLLRCRFDAGLLYKPLLLAKPKFGFSTSELRAVGQHGVETDPAALAEMRFSGALYQA
jgi:hypothetical protein